MGTVIKLFYCKKCGSIMDDTETAQEKPCRNCDCRMMGLAAPTKMNIFRYVKSHPNVILTWVHENVFKRNR